MAALEKEGEAATMIQQPADGGVELEPEEEGEREVRERRDGETRAELKQIQKLRKVKDSLKTMLANTLARTQLEKVRNGPIHIHRVRRRPSRRRSNRRRWSREEREAVVSSSDERKKKQPTWVVGHVGEKGVKDRHKDDEEELKDLRTLGVVQERLKERVKVRAQAHKIFKHRYELDPESTHKSSTILVTGYEEGEGGAQKVAELIRQQSQVVIQNFFKRPVKSRAVLSRLTSTQLDSIEASERRKTGNHQYTMSEPFVFEGTSDEEEIVGRSWVEGAVGGAGVSKHSFHRGSSINGRVDQEAPSDSSSHTDTGIPKAPPLPPLIPLATPIPQAPPIPLAPPPNSGYLHRDEDEVFDEKLAHNHQRWNGVSSRETMKRASIVSDCSEGMEDTDSGTSDMASPVSMLREENSTPSPNLNRSNSYVTAMEQDTLATIVEADTFKSDETGRPKSAKTAVSQKKELKKEARGRGRRKRGSSLGKADMETLESHYLPSRQKSKEQRGEASGLTLTELADTADVELEAEEDGAGGERDDVAAPESSTRKPPSLEAHIPRPLHPPTSQLAAARPPHVHHRLSPQASVVSLPGCEATNTRFYTTLSPRVDSITGTHTDDINPFASDFERALKEKQESQTSTAAAAASNLTQLPPEAFEDEGFLAFLQQQDAKPSRSLYISYKIMLISEQIDSKYSKQLNQALDSIFHEVLKKELSWDKFSATCRQLMLEGEKGFMDGVFMVPAFGRRLLMFLPGMRELIMNYTQDVLDQYATEWLLTKGGWGHLLNSYDQEEEGRERGAGPAGYSYYTDEDLKYFSSDDELEEELYAAAMGYGLVTPEPETHNGSLATVGHEGMDISAVQPLLSTIDEQVSVIEDRPLGGDGISCTGSELFLVPLHDVAPPIGRGLRRVISVEVLFLSEEDQAVVEERGREMAAIRRQSLNRVSSLPSMSGSVSSPSSAIPIPVHHRLSTDHSSSLSSSPSSLVFSLPSMRGKRDSLASNTSSIELNRQASSTSVDSTIRIITGGTMSPSTPASAGSPRKRHSFEPSQLTQPPFQFRTSQTGVSTIDGMQDAPTHKPTECDQPKATPTTNEFKLEATPTPHSKTTSANSTNDSQISPTLPTNQTNDPQATPTSDDHRRQATHLVQEREISTQQSLTESSGSSDAYVDYGLEESGNGSMTEWEWEWAESILLLSPVLPHVVGAGFVLVNAVFRSN